PGDSSEGLPRQGWLCHARRVLDELRLCLPRGRWISWLGVVQDARRLILWRHPGSFASAHLDYHHPLVTGPGEQQIRKDLEAPGPDRGGHRNGPPRRRRLRAVPGDRPRQVERQGFAQVYESNVYAVYGFFGYRVDSRAD